MWKSYTSSYFSFIDHRVSLIKTLCAFQFIFDSLKIGIKHLQT